MSRRLLPLLLITSAAMADDLVVESFGGTASALSGQAATNNLLSSANWSAGPIFLANGAVNDGSNTDQGAYLDLGADFAFKSNATYTLSLGYSGLSNAILFAGFSTSAANPSAQAQVQGTNFALRIREQSTTPGTGLWINNGSNSFTASTTASPAGSGSSTLTIVTNNLSNATAAVDGGAAVAINLSATAYRHLYIGYEDPASGNSDAVLESLVLTGPAAAAPLPSVSISPGSKLLRPGQTVTLATTGGLTIRYTLDGRDPDAASPTYAGPLTLAASGGVRARAFSGSSAGPVSSAHFAVIPAALPNVLLIVGDDVGFNDLGCYGAVSVATPRLDALACEGQRFTQFITAGPGDVASQYALLTGRLARRGGMPAVVPPASPGIDTREWTLAEAFRKAGYHTAFVGGWQLGNLPGSRPNDQGFVLFHGLPWRATLTPAPPLLEGSNTLDPAPDANTLLDEMTTRAEGYITSHAAEPFFLTFQPPSLPATGASLLGTYGNRIEALDRSVGRLLDQLATSGVADKTLVIFLSDEGADKNTGGYPTGSNGQQRDGKGSTWEGGVHVPLIARWPGVIPTGDNQAVLWLPDLFRSLGAIANAYQPADHPSDASDRCDVLLGARTRPDDSTALFLHRHNGSGYALQALRLGKWKLHTTLNSADPDNTFSGTPPLLLDLEVDPIEHVNRAAAESAVVAALQQSAAAHNASFSAPVPQLPVARGEFLGPVLATITETASRTATFHFTRPADSLNDHYVLQSGNDLSGWTDVSIDPYVSISPGPDGTEVLQVSVPLTSLGGTASRFFVRLKATRP